jgi:hypothetical protein
MLGYCRFVESQEATLPLSGCLITLSNHLDSPCIRSACTHTYNWRIIHTNHTKRSFLSFFFSQSPSLSFRISEPYPPPLLGVSSSLDLYLKALSFNTGVSFRKHCGGFTSTSHRPNCSSFYGLSRWCRSESDWGATSSFRPSSGLEARGRSRSTARR